MNVRNRLLGIGTAALALGLLTGTASAAVVVTASVGGAPSGAILENLNSLTLGNAGGVTPTLVTVSFTGGGQAVQGASSGVYAAPFLTGSNGTGFGSPDQPNGADVTTYLTAGGTSGDSATLDFGTDLHYVGLLWGSIDTYNTLQLWEGGLLVATITGSDAAAAALTLPNGNQGANGTAYVNINSTDAFDRIVALSTNFAFEFDNIAFNAQQCTISKNGTMFALVNKKWVRNWWG